MDDGTVFTASAIVPVRLWEQWHVSNYLKDVANSSPDEKIEANVSGGTGRPGGISTSAR